VKLFDKKNCLVDGQNQAAKIFLTAPQFAQCLSLNEITVDHTRKEQKGNKIKRTTCLTHIQIITRSVHAKK